MSDELSSEDEVLANHLAAGLIYTKAAEVMGCHPNTVYRRMADPSFRGRVETIRRAIAKQVYARITSRLDDVVETLHLLATSSEDENVRIKAGATLLDHHLKMHEKLDLDDRIRRLESLNGG